MDWGNYLFSFQGRLNRAKYWLFVLIGLIVMFVLGLIVFALHFSIAAFAVTGILYLVLIYAAIAVGAKRLHDRDKSAWWLLLFYLGPGILDGAGRAMSADAITWLQLVLSIISFVIAIWGLIELGILRGTVGPNTYGPDPLKERA
jgi:uncharacterized membrane protein YhaH (DUF805 family)